VWCRTAKPVQLSPWAREAVRQPGDDDKVAAEEELGGRGARARRGEESEDGCDKGWAKASAFYRG
jgi:hypothetical protein